MSRICPHCNHARSPSDTVPEWQCPACQRAYNKAGGTVDANYGRTVTMRSGRPEGGRRKWLVGLAAGGLAVWFGKPLWSGAQGKLAPAATGEQPEVLLYATEWCGYCAAARQFFAANGIRYTEFDVEKSAAAREGQQKLGGNGVPIIVVGTTVIHGFNQAQLRDSLKPWLRGS